MWTFEKPAQAGWYFVNNGDVVTDANFECIKFKSDEDGNLIDSDDVHLFDYNSSYKYMPIGIESLNLIGNKD